MNSTTPVMETLIPTLDGKPESHLVECIQKIASRDTSLILLSGGIDSTTLLYLAQTFGNTPT